MSTLPFYVLDVFAESKYAGNQLAVFRGAEKLSSVMMQKIAREMNFSETTFILSEQEKGGGYDVRIFTPAEEVPFAGHPTLGTASVIRREIIGKDVDKVTLNLKVGQIPVTFDGDLVWMRQKSPSFGRLLDPLPVLSALGLNVVDHDKKFPIQEVSTGLPFIIVPLTSLASVKRAAINKPLYDKLIKPLDAKAILFFCAETYDPWHNLNARMFADHYGVPEDPATGSANGCLAAYLVKYKYFGETRIDIKVEQGYEIGRPSLLYLKSKEFGGVIEVNVGGKVEIVAIGEFV